MDDSKIMNQRTSIDTGTSWEKIAGYARAVRIGNMIAVSGTTATDIHGNVVGLGDPATQTQFILTKIENALTQLGASMQNVIRTRIYVRYIADWEPVARAHGERFAIIRPANTLVEARLVGEEYLVEIEADAVI